MSVNMSANFGSYRPIDYAANPGAGLKDFGDRLGNVVSNVPNLVREGQKWGDEMNRRNANENMKALIYRRVSRLLEGTGITVPPPDQFKGMSAEEYGAYAAAPAIAEAERTFGTDMMLRKSASDGKKFDEEEGLSERGKIGAEPTQNSEGKTTLGGNVPTELGTPSSPMTTPAKLDAAFAGSGLEAGISALPKEGPLASLRKSNRDNRVQAFQKLKTGDNAQQSAYAQLMHSGEIADMERLNANDELSEAMRRDKFNTGGDWDDVPWYSPTEQSISPSPVSPQFAVPGTPLTVPAETQPAPAATAPAPAIPHGGTPLYAPPASFGEAANSYAQLSDPGLRTAYNMAAGIGGRDNFNEYASRRDAINAERYGGMKADVKRGQDLTDSETENERKVAAATTKNEWETQAASGQAIKAAFLDGNKVYDKTTGRQISRVDLDAAMRNPAGYRIEYVRPPRQSWGWSSGAQESTDARFAITQHRKATEELLDLDNDDLKLNDKTFDTKTKLADKGLDELATKYGVETVGEAKDIIAAKRQKRQQEVDSMLGYVKNTKGTDEYVNSIQPAEEKRESAAATKIWETVFKQKVVTDSNGNSRLFPEKREITEAEFNKKIGEALDSAGRTDTEQRKRIAQQVLKKMSKVGFVFYKGE
jgi:hypothetical protein